MSFSSQVKNELVNYNEKARHCKIALLSGIINYCGLVTGQDLKISSENDLLMVKCKELLKELFGIKTDIVHISDNKEVILLKECFKVISTTGVRNDFTVNPLIISSQCCKRAYLRGAFLASGSITNPEKAYHIEFVNHSEKQAEELKNIINTFSIPCKYVERKGHYVVYIKEGEYIVDMLNIINAHLSLLNFENLRVVKQVRNNINRKVNCETANLNKTISAAVKQIQDIEYIDKRIGLDSLPYHLEQIARLRLEYSDVSLLELGKKLTPAVGKSGVNHRLKKISLIAEELREETL